LLDTSTKSRAGLLAAAGQKRFDIFGCSIGMTSIKGWIRIVPDVEQDCPRDCGAGNLCDPSEPNIDQLRLDPKAGCPVAVDGQGQRRAAGLLVGCDVTQLWRCDVTQLWRCDVTQLWPDLDSRTGFRRGEWRKC
jgi:hypothetical protein